MQKKKLILKVSAMFRTLYYHFDGQVNVTLVSDESGEKAESYRYGPYGGVSIFDSKGQSLSASAVGNLYFYSGRELDFETGFYYYRYRYYDPRAGRFITKDLIGVRGGLNLYAYVQNSPLKWIDPFGLQKYLVTIQTEIRGGFEAGVKSTQTLVIDTDSGTASSTYTTGTTDWGIGHTPSRSDDFNVSQPSGSNGIYTVTADESIPFLVETPERLPAF